MTAHWICSQIGAREHYAIPRALHGDGRLERLVTDLWVPARLGRGLRRFGAPGRRLGDRRRPELDDARVTSFPWRGLRWAIQARRKTGEDLYRLYAAQGEWFSRRTAKILAKAPEDAFFFGYDTGFLEAGQAAGERGIPSMVCQMDPGRFEIELVRKEARAWPGWERHPLQVPESYHRRREAEWAVADRVMVNSDWTRNALVSQGVDPEKIVVIPLCFEVSPGGDGSRPRPPGVPLEVLWLGSVILRKGIQYLMEAARLLLSENVRFTVVGPIGITEKAMRSAPANLRFAGPAPRSEADGYYESADLFVLPTLSDGFAITQLEAMAFGLPVIATPNCGEVVIEGENGYRVPARDAAALAGRIGELAGDRERLQAMSAAARRRSRDFGMAPLLARLIGVEEDLAASSGGKTGE